jgi:hypothetical protein
MLNILLSKLVNIIIGNIEYNSLEGFFLTIFNITMSNMDSGKN